jgi:hypothetical protein
MEILACGTCLGHYDLKEKVVIDEISNMYTIAETMLEAGNTINLQGYHFGGEICRTRGFV